MAEITNVERLPFPLAKPNADTFVTQASEIGHNGQPLDEALSALDSISKESAQSEEDTIVFETDGGVQVGKIDSTGADFANLKRGGQQVARMSDLPSVPTLDTSIGENPSNNHTPSSKAVKDYVDVKQIDLPITEETTASEDEEMEFTNDACSQSYVKVGDYGIKSKAYLDLNGNNVIPTKDTTIGETPSETNVPTSKAVTDYVDAHGGGVGDLPISQEDTQDESEEVIWGDDAGTQEYMKVGSYGIKAKAYLNMAGENILDSVSSNKLDPYNVDLGKMTHISVKKDGNGDYTTIQAAINSIEDASFINQYCIDVFDDFIYEELTDLYYCFTPDSHCEYTTSDNKKVISGKQATTIYSDSRKFVSIVSLVKDYVHLRGVGERKKIIYRCPADVKADNYQYIQTVFLAGNVIIDNFQIEIYAGRYAVHQDLSGYNNANNPDINAVSTISNCVIRHHGNDGYTSSWTALHAQANGISDGQKMVFLNTLFLSAGDMVPFYFHTNSKSGLPYINCPEAVFDNCQFLKENGLLASGNIQDYGSGQKTRITIKNSSLGQYQIIPGMPVYATQQMGTALDNWWNGGAILLGGGNEYMAVTKITPSVLTFRAKNNASSIHVTGGTAKELIFGDAHRVIPHSNYTSAYTQGSIRIKDSSYTYIWNIAWRLGNCASTNKTLVLNIAGDTYTMVFDEDYMGGGTYTYNTAPQSSYDTNAKFIDYMLSIHPQEDNTITFADLMDISISDDASYYLDAVQDCKIVGRMYNISSAIPAGFPLKRGNTANRWIIPSAGDKIDGVLAEPFNPDIDSIANIIVGKSMFLKAYLWNETESCAKGEMIKWTGSGFSKTANQSEACFIAKKQENIFIINK